jgi:hypothetical protein
MVSDEQYQQLARPQPRNLLQFFRESPLVGIALDLERDKDEGRDNRAMTGFLLVTNCLSEVARCQTRAPCHGVDRSGLGNLALSERPNAR